MRSSSASRSAPPAGSFRRRLNLAVRTVVSAGLIALLLHQAGGRSILEQVLGVSPAWFALGLLLGVGAAGLQANQWRGLLEVVGLPRTYAATLRADTAARGFDALLPSSIGGDVIRVSLATDRPDQRGRAVVSVLLRRLMQLPGLVAVLGAGSLASLGLSYAGPVRAIAASCAVAGVLGGLLVLLAARAGALQRLPRRLRVLAQSVTETSAAAGGHPFFRASLRGLVFWCVVALSQVCFTVAAGVHVPFGYAVAVVAVVNTLSLLPISVGGYGLREGAFGAFLAASGHATLAQGAVVGACLSLQTFAFGLIGGLVYLLSGRQVAAPVVPAGPAPTAAVESVS